MVLLIFAWLAGGAMTNLSGSANRRAGDEHAAGAVAVHWDGGRLTNRELNELVGHRHVLNNFLRNVEMEGRRPAYEAGVDPRPLRVEPMIGPDTQQEHVEQSVVQTKLFADAARDAGMKVSDETIRQYLDEWGRGNVSRDKMRAILTGMKSGGWRASIDDMIATLREEMLARNYVNSQQFAFDTVTPQQRWEDWRLVNDRVVIEAAAIPAESMMAQVKEPTEQDLVDFFNHTDAAGIAYKDREASPDLVYGSTVLPSPTPGFKIPRKVDLQFVQATYDDFVTKAEAKVTDAEIAKFYDEHKNLFEKADTGLMEEKDQKKDGTKPDSSATENETSAAEDAATKTKSKQDANNATEPDNKKTTEPAPPGAKSPPAPKSDEPPASKDEKNKSEPADEKKSSPADEKKSSYRITPSTRLFRLTALEKDAEKESPKDDGAAKDKASTAENSTPDKATEKSTEKPEGKPAGAEKPAAPAGPTGPELKTGGAPAKPEETPAGSPPGDSAKADSSPAPAAPKKPVQYQPLSEVKDLIRRQLAETQVTEQLTKLTNEIHNQLESDFNDWRFSEKTDSDDGKGELPAPPKSLADLTPVAEKNGLKHGRTGPKSALELRDMPLGKSQVPDSNRSLLSLLFAGHELELYQPVSTVDVESNRYESIKMSDTPARVPTLKEVRAEVVAAWKKQQASELALKRAEEFAKKAEEAKASLADVFGEDQAIKVIRTDPFSQLTGGEVSLATNQPQPFRLGQPDGIVTPGPEFMKRVFALKDDAVGVAFNHDHSIAYVIRMVEHQPGLGELRTAFLTEADTWPGRTTMTQGHMQVLREGLMNDIGPNFKWDRDPDKTTKDDQAGEG